MLPLLYILFNLGFNIAALNLLKTAGMLSVLCHCYNMPCHNNLDCPVVIILTWQVAQIAQIASSSVIVTCSMTVLVRRVS